jgi:hypothetical protein
MKLLDYALCDEPTEKRAIVHIADAPTKIMPVVRRCDGYPFDAECGAPAEKPYTMPSGAIKHLCGLHHYKIVSAEKWEQWRREGTA